MAKRKFWIYYNVQNLTADFSVDEFGWHCSDAGYSFEETRVNYIIHFVRKGICHLTIWSEKNKRKEYTVREGEAFVIFAGVRHKYVSDEVQPCERGWFSVSGESSEGMFLRCGISKDTVVLKNIDVVLVDKYFKELKKVIRSSDDIAFRLYTLAYQIFDMLNKLGLNVEKYEFSWANKKRLIDAVTQYIKNNVSCTLQISDIAQKFGYERTWLYRLFKKEKGISMKNYITDMCIQKARYLLTETNKGCMQIASELGYSSYAGFVRVFKEHVGRMPDDYRRSSRFH